MLARPVMQQDDIESRVKPVLQAIKNEGDAAVKRFTAQFDQVELDDLKVTAYEMEQAEQKLPEDLKSAIKAAKINIEKFHTLQHERVRKVETMPGVLCWRKSIAIQKVGLYIPGGTAPLFSSVLMLAVPAAIAGCQEIVLCTPPGKDGKVHPAILFTAALCGVTQIFKIGGAQAVAAMAYGTESVPRVYKIFGPGNQYVTAAKQLVTRQGVGIDMPAGPSEVAVLADETADPAFVAADLLSQAEHGTDSQVLLVTNSPGLAEKAQAATLEQLESLPRKEIAASALENSRCIVLEDMQEAIALINEYAAEHLILSVDNPEEVAGQIINAGSVFLGHYTPESAGDYASGTNHTLPTYGYARIYSGVSLDSFIRKVTFQQISEEGLQQLGPVVEAMAAAEELEAHRRAVSIRRQKIAAARENKS